jgi:hypothetical protein
MVLGIWIGTAFQEEFNKVEFGHGAPVACMVQGRCALWDRFKFDVGAVYNKLSCKDELVFMGWLVARISQIGQLVEQSTPQLTFLQLLVLASRQHVGTDALKQHEKWTVWPSISESDLARKRNV